MYILVAGQLHPMQRFAFLPRYCFVSVPPASSSAILYERGSPQAFLSARKKKKKRNKSIKTREKCPNTGPLNGLCTPLSVAEEQLTFKMEDYTGL